MNERARVYEMTYGHRQTAIGQPHTRAVTPVAQHSSAGQSIEEILRRPDVLAEAQRRAEMDKHLFPDD